MKTVVGAMFLVLAAGLAAGQQSPASPQTGTSNNSDTKQASPARTSLGDQSNPITTIKVPVNLVNVLFTVTDKKERMVLNLTKDDFQVLEDKIPQTVTNFSRESNLPLRIGILVDTSNSIRERLHFEQEAAVDFLNETLRPGKDQAFVVAFDVEPQLLQDYTDDVEKLSTAIRGLQAGGGTGLYDAIYFSCKQKLLIFPPPEPYLRRVMIVISDGLDNQSQHTREEALSMAERAEVVIYTISTNRSGVSTRGDKVLKRFAEETGGRAFFPFEARDLASNFQEISRQLRSQYSLAYVSTNKAHDGTFRAITLQTSERGLRVQAKNGYFAPSQ